MNNTIPNARASGDSSINKIILAMPYIANIWIGTFLLIMGNIGCIGNVIVFRSESFRNRAYTIYLFAETISDFFVMNLILLTRVIEKGFGIPVYNSGYDFICKIRQTSSYYFILTSFTFFTLATLDRILSAQRSNSFRKWSNRVSLAYKMVIICTLFWFLLMGHRLYIYTVTNGKCKPIFAVYNSIDNYIEAVFIEICPLIIVFVFAYLLRKSLQNIVQRQAIVVTVARQPIVGKRSRIQQIDSQITLTLLLQTIAAIISFLLHGSNILYAHITETWYKTPLQVAIENIMDQVTHVLLYTFFATSFHISIISSSGFRREIKRLFQKNMVHPTNWNSAGHKTSRVPFQDDKPENLTG